MIKILGTFGSDTCGSYSLNFNNKFFLPIRETVFPSVLINFSRYELFSTRQKGQNQKWLSWERLLANQEWWLGPPEIFNSSGAPRGFWHRICMTSSHRYVSDLGRQCIGSRGASVRDRADPSGFFSLHLSYMYIFYELRLSIFFGHSRKSG